MKELTQLEQKQLVNFFDACNEMINGRFILSDIKIQNILKSVADSALLYDLFSKALINFNFERELADAKTANRVNGGYFNMPKQRNKILALVFCLLLEVNDKKLNLQEFITDNFFSQQGYNISYSNFSLVILVPFKNAVMQSFKCNEKGEQNELEQREWENNQVAMIDVLEQTEEYHTNEKISFANLRVALAELVGAIKDNKKLKTDQKEELLIVSNAIADAINNENTKIISALTIAFEYALQKNKSIKPYYEHFLQIFVDML